MKKQYIQPQSTIIACESLQTICAASGGTRISVNSGFIPPTGYTGD